MFGPLRSHLTRSARRPIVWCLLVSVPLYGLSGSLVELLGSKRVHRSEIGAGMALVATPSGTTRSDAFGGLVDFRRLASGHAPAEHGHSHDAFERHHHGPDDATVIALDGGHGTAAEDGGSPAASHVLALNTPGAFDVTPLPALAWPAALPPAIAPWAAAGMERPPKA